jgi:hypothetical protein
VPKQTTIGWKFLVGWKDSSSDWTDLKDLKGSNPVEVAECAVANKIVEEPAFKWWAANALVKKAQSDHLKVEEPTLEDDSQVWHQGAEIGG